jgi:Uma2 family endonuclease
MFKPHTIDRTVWDYAAYALIPNDGNRHEVIAGEHFVNAAPNIYHQEVSGRLYFQLYSTITLANLGTVLFAPVDVELTEHDVIQPDLVVIRKSRREILVPTRVRGTPDLVVEILSPSNLEYDLTTKRQLYERCGVPEYWIVDPIEHKAIHLLLRNGVYQETVCLDEITFDLPPVIRVELNLIW